MKHRKNPHIYEINLKTWLSELSLAYQRKISLKNIPLEEWRNLKSLGMDLVWLMGIWERSPDSIARARNEPDLIKECRRLLPDFQIDDITGSPYAIHDYVPDPAFGSLEDLLSLKKSLEQEGLFLVLDFVPNHTACDHPWITRHPEYYIMKDINDGKNCDAGFFLSGDHANRKCIAHGKDPYFPPWTDTAQINYAEQDTVDAVTDILFHLSSCCHGVRCDMAMLVLKDIFTNTWGPYLINDIKGPDFWPYAIDKLKDTGNPFLLMAEVYWGKERTLLHQGFDYVYDKHLYDMMVHGSPGKIRECISSPISMQENLVRFLENHDEPRAAASFGPGRIESAMVIHATLPGMRFWHHGQLEGKRHKVPVQLGRGPVEETNNELRSFGEILLKEVNNPIFHEGSFIVCDTHGWPDNNSHTNLIAYAWEMGREKLLIVVNFSSSPAQGYVTLPVGWAFSCSRILIRDPLKGDKYERLTKDIINEGLYTGLDKGDYHFFKIQEV